MDGLAGQKRSLLFRFVWLFDVGVREATGSEVTQTDAGYLRLGEMSEEALADYLELLLWQDRLDKGDQTERCGPRERDGN